MKNIAMGLEQIEEEILVLEVSDEALEIAEDAAMEKAKFTLMGCTDLTAQVEQSTETLRIIARRGR